MNVCTQGYKITLRRQAIATARRMIAPTFLVFLLLFVLPAQANQWRPVALGIEYLDLGAHLLSPWSHVHVFRIDLKKNKPKKTKNINIKYYFSVKKAGLAQWVGGQALNLMGEGSSRPVGVYNFFYVNLSNISINYL